MASISNQWLKGGKEWWPVNAKLELNKNEYGACELTLRKEIGIFKCLNKDCLNNEETEKELNSDFTDCLEDPDCNLDWSYSWGSCHYCNGSLDFVERKTNAEFQTVMIDTEESEEIANLIAESFNDEKSSKLLSKLIVKLSDKSKLGIIREILDNR